VLDEKLGNERESPSSKKIRIWLESWEGSPHKPKKGVFKVNKVNLDQRRNGNKKI